MKFGTVMQVDHLDRSGRQIFRPEVEIRQFYTCALKNDTVIHNRLGYGADTTFYRIYF